VSLIYGKAADYKDDAGFNDQYGAEVFWSFKPNHWFTIITNVQFTRNIYDDVETIVGLRIGLGFERNWPESSLIQP
jgi:hypothetical protein